MTVGILDRGDIVRNIAGAKFIFQSIAIDFIVILSLIYRYTLIVSKEPASTSGRMHQCHCWSQHSSCPPEESSRQPAASKGKLQGFIADT